MPKLTVYYATKRLEQYRLKKGWTQEQFADFLSLKTGLDITRSNVKSWEKQYNGMKDDIVLEVANALRIPVRELVEQREAKKQ